MRRQLRIIATGLAALIIPNTAMAAEDSPFSLSLGAGLQYDSNITVDAQDLTTGLGDEALVIEGGAGFEFGDERTLQFSGGYDFYQTLHQDLTNFDLQVHSASLGLLRQVGNADLGLDYSFSHIRLGGDALLNTHGIRPNIGYLIGDSVYVLGAYEYQKREFDTLDRRDADRHSGSGDIFVFFGSGQYVFGGYELERESATGPEFTFWGHDFNIGLNTTFALASIQPEWELEYRYYKKDYSNITPSIGEERSDKRHNVSASLILPLFGGFELEPRYEYIDANSNLASVDYTEHIVTGTVRWRY